MACLVTAPSHHTWTNVDLSLVKSSDIHLRAISQEVPRPRNTKLSLKITSKVFHYNHPGTNELTWNVHSERISDLCEICNDLTEVGSLQYMSFWYHIFMWLLYMRRHQMVTFSALLAFCVGNSPVTGEFPTQRPMTRSFDVSSHSRLNQHLSKQWGRQWFEAPWHSLKLICLNQLDLPSVQWHIAARSRHQLCDGFLGSKRFDSWKESFGLCCELWRKWQ